MRQRPAVSAVAQLAGAEPCAPAAVIGLARDAQQPAATQASAGNAAPVSVECAKGDRLSEIRSDWLDLVNRCLEPNVFVDPNIVRSAEQHLPDHRCVTLLVWQRTRGREELVGLWALSIRRPPMSLLPVSVLLAPPVPHAYLSTPVIDRSAPVRTLDAMLDFIAGDTRLPNVAVLDPIRTDGPTMQVLARVMQLRGGNLRVLTETQRPMLASGLRGEEYLGQAMSGPSRKKLRQYRRRLGERGSLDVSVSSAPEDVCVAFEQFLQLEAAGWKGRSGTALVSDPAEAAYARAMIAAMAGSGAASIHALSLDGRPVSMQVVLRCGAVAFTWKTAYDETMREFSPGMLLLEDYTRAFLADESIASVDSCAYDEQGFMSVWQERQAMAQVWIDAGRGRSLRLPVICSVQKAYLGLRSRAKCAYQSWKGNGPASRARA